MIKVTMRLKGPLKKYGPGSEQFEHKNDSKLCTVYDILQNLDIPASSVSFIQIDDRKVDHHTRLKGGEVVTVYPRVSGG